MKALYDTEFVEQGPEHPIHFVSIGMVTEDGRELYAVNADLDQHLVRSHPFVGEHVWPHLPLVDPKPGVRGGSHKRLDLDHPDVHPRAKIARMVSAFLAQVPDVELWAWYGAYDHVVLAQLFGTMVDLPDHIPMYTNDLKQEAARLGNPQLPEQPDGEHHALADARHNLTRARALNLLER